MGTGCVFDPFFTEQIDIEAISSEQVFCLTNYYRNRHFKENCYYETVVGIAIFSPLVSSTN